MELREEATGAITVLWPEGHVYGDSFQLGRAKHLVAARLGVKRPRVVVTSVEIEGGKVFSITFDKA